MITAITGGSGSGKSFVCRLLAERGIEIYDCDAAAKRLMRNSAELRQQLSELIGSHTYFPDGRLNKAAVAAFLLQSDDHAQAINDIVHPAVARDFIESGYQWMECAILYESGFDRLVDRVIAVTAPDDVRIRRIVERDGITPEEARQWINRQWPQQKTAMLADLLIVNDGIQPLLPQIDRIIYTSDMTEKSVSPQKPNKKKYERDHLSHLR